MAQKKLLSVVKLPVFLMMLMRLLPLLILLCSGTARSEAGSMSKVNESETESKSRNMIFNFKAQDLKKAQAITAKARQMTYQEIKTKWLELQNMLGNNDSRNPNDASLATAAALGKREWGTAFRIFVSSSMSKSLLKAYAQTSKEYDAVLVFNGLPGGSWHELSNLVAEISGDNPEYVAMQIDDEAFTKFGVTEVPSFVLSKEEDMFAVNPITTFDKVSGSIGIKSALEMFAGSGQLKDLANSKLKQHGVGNE